MSYDDDKCKICGEVPLNPDDPSQLDRIESMLTALTKDLDAMMSKANDVLETAGPTIEKLSNHPMMKMLGVGTKR
jgi:hypothetical protein